MRSKTLVISRPTLLAAAVLVVANVGGCAEGSNPAKDIAVSLGAGPKAAETPDFVARSRPQALDYMPIGTAQAGRATPARTADQIKAAEAELDALRAQNEAAGAAAAELGKTPAPQPAKVPAARTTRPKTP